MLEIRLLLVLFAFSFAPIPSLSREPYTLRISCGSRDDVHSPPTNTLWHKDFAYTGGLPTKATRPSTVSPLLNTVRYFPFSEGPENCYNLNWIPHGHFLVRVYLGLMADSSFEVEPLFDISIEGTLIYSLPSGWSVDDARGFVDVLIFLKEGTASICFHSTGHGDPAILAIEILQISNKAYNFGRYYGQGTMMRVDRRINCGANVSKFGVDYNADHWGGNRFWKSLSEFGSGRSISTSNRIKKVSLSPNFYPEAIYQTAFISSDSERDLAYSMEVEPNRNYSIWLHFAEIDPSIKDAGQRVFDIYFNGDIVYEDIDIVKMAGGVNTALVLNTTTVVSGRSLTITLRPIQGTSAIINAIEVIELVKAESKTFPSEIKALQRLKSTLALPFRFGWNGDPCVPKQHPWSGVYCQYNRNITKYVITGLGLDNQGLRGFLPDEISRFRHLQSINLSGNSISGSIPPSLGMIKSLEILDLSFNYLIGPIPESIGQLTSLKILDVNGNSLSGEVPVALGGRLLHGASFNFTDNSGLCGIPGLKPCGSHLSNGAKVGIALGTFLFVLLFVTCLTCWWKRRKNILRSQKIGPPRVASYAQSKISSNRDLQMSRNHGTENSRTAAENGPSLLA